MPCWANPTEIFYLALSIEVPFKHVGHLTNGFVDFLAKQEMGRSSNRIAIIL